MAIYIIFSSLAAIALSIFWIVRTQRPEGAKYAVSDKVGFILNAVLLNVYLIFFAPVMFITLLCVPMHDGFLGVIGWIIAFVIGSTSAVSFLGLGASVALRKEGKSKLSFLVQFAGIVLMVLSFIVFALCYGRLFEFLNGV